MGSISVDLNGTGETAAKSLSCLRDKITDLTKKLHAEILVEKTGNRLFYRIFGRKGFLILRAGRFSPGLLERIALEAEQAGRVTVEPATCGEGGTEYGNRYPLRSSGRLL
ncbi:hypothetical protein A7X67_17425 [Clostridium sp. W14A]|nr:hypothetical protein A7X67_17425 [Clostridium sp. W14A]